MWIPFMGKVFNDSDSICLVYNPLLLTFCTLFIYDAQLHVQTAFVFNPWCTNFIEDLLSECKSQEFGRQIKRHPGLYPYLRSNLIKRVAK